MPTYLSYEWMLLKEKLRGALKSWTVWFNALMATAIPFLDYAQDQIPSLSGLVPSDFYRYVLGAVVVANLFLRFKTDRSLASK